MKMLGFNAEVAIGPSKGRYQAIAVSGPSSGAEVLPMLGKQCGNCEIVGGFGRIRGVGRRSCCQQVWNPITKRVEQSCWFESCIPDRVSSGLLSF
jgi:hypothetical protein